MWVAYIVISKCQQLVLAYHELVSGHLVGQWSWSAANWRWLDVAITVVPASSVDTLILIRFQSDRTKSYKLGPSCSAPLILQALSPFSSDWHLFVDTVREHIVNTKSNLPHSDCCLPPSPPPSPVTNTCLVDRKSLKPAKEAFNFKLGESFSSIAWYACLWWHICEAKCVNPIHWDRNTFDQILLVLHLHLLALQQSPWQTLVQWTVNRRDGSNHGVACFQFLNLVTFFMLLQSLARNIMSPGFDYSVSQESIMP